VYIADRADGSVSDDVVDDAVSASGVASRSDKPPAAVSPPSRGSRGAGGISIAARGCWLTFLHSQKFIACDADVVHAEFLCLDAAHSQHVDHDEAIAFRDGLKGK